uniref:Uncharacterized protein n=1 Tax=Mycena chlorophos TaxID=658473 RepID=A0ABQ0M1W4_MYCCL|nr:predicted protein [Mycena chlorophos]
MSVDGSREEGASCDEALEYSDKTLESLGAQNVAILTGYPLESFFCCKGNLSSAVQREEYAAGLRYANRRTSAQAYERKDELRELRSAPECYEEAGGVGASGGE